MATTTKSAAPKATIHKKVAADEAVDITPDQDEDLDARNRARVAAQGFDIIEAEWCDHQRFPVMVVWSSDTGGHRVDLERQYALAHELKGDWRTAYVEVDDTTEEGKEPAKPKLVKLDDIDDPMRLRQMTDAARRRNMPTVAKACKERRLAVEPESDAIVRKHLRDAVKRFRHDHSVDELDLNEQFDDMVADAWENTQD